jgi:hypothetical protein
MFKFIARGFSIFTRRNTMTKLLKLTFIAATAAVALGSPAFAGAYLNEMGTGDLHPIVHPHAASWGFTGSSYNDRYGYNRPRHVASRRGGLHAYAMVDQQWGNPDDPALSGGGSLGYNANLHNH